MTVVDDIKGRLDIVEVVSRYVPLQRSGRSHKANCPFHQEKTPSFHVFPDRQTWRCFGACATGGDVFSFVMRAEGLGFADVRKDLAQQAGVALPDRQRRTEQESGLEINEAARTYFQRHLESFQGAEAREYLKSRGVSPETISKFELGLSPSDGESLKQHLTGQGFSPQQLAQSGIVRTSQNGRLLDLFRGRLMFPIRNAQGGLGGFGARAMDDSQPKYLNSPRTPTFDKGHILYGLNLAKDPVRQKGAVIVEGYMDAIAAHQEGFDNVVASMGTALTENQVAEIRRLTSNITMALDADAAGQQATLRSLESSWRVFQAHVTGRVRGTTLLQRPESLDLKIAVMPAGQDPDDVIHRSPAEWTGIVGDGQSLIEYLLAALSTQADVSTPDGKALVVGAVLPLIQATAEPFQQDHYFQMLADTLGVTRDELRATVDRPMAVRRRPQRPAPPTRQPASPAFAKDGDPVEEYCLTLLLKHPDLEEPAERLKPEYFRRLENREIFSQWLRVCQGDEAQSGPEALADLVGEELAGPLDRILQKETPPPDPQKRIAAFEDVVRKLEILYLKDLKLEEELRFKDSPPDLSDEAYMDVLNVNERIKENQVSRQAGYQNIGGRG